MDGAVPEHLTDWRGRPWAQGSAEKAAHPNSRFTSQMDNNPAISPMAQDPKGVPISAIIFGGRRSTTVPLVLHSFNWTHGVYLGATMGSETTAAATGTVGVVRRDPMAMLPFCGYDMGAYFDHWLKMSAQIADPPKIFIVNWFRKDADGSFMWPGFGENMRVLEWIIDRCDDAAGAVETPVGWAPRAADLNTSDLDIRAGDLEKLLAIDPGEWKQELGSHAEWFAKLGSSVPVALELQRQLLVASIGIASGAAEL